MFGLYPKSTALFAENGNGNLSPVASAPVLEKKNALPRAELHFPIDNRHGLARARQHHANM